MIQITSKDLKKIKRELSKAEDGLDEYAETLSDTWTCRKHLNAIYEILDKYKEVK